MVIPGRIGPGRDTDGVSGGGMEVGGGGYRWDGYRYGGLIMWEDTVTNSILGTDPNNLLGYAPVLELRQPIMSMLGGNGFQLKRDNRITRIIFWIINSLFRKKLFTAVPAVP